MGIFIHTGDSALDAMAEDPRVDADHLAVAGHSLGGKLAFYTGCLDERINVMICSDFGIRWQQSNWGEAWYWGRRLPELQAAGAEQKELLASAGKPMFLIAGEFDDKGIVLVFCSEQAIKQGYAAWALIQKFLKPLGANGGGKPDFATGGIKDVAQLRTAWKSFNWNAFLS